MMVGAEMSSTIDDGVKRFEAEGYTDQFRVDRTGRVKCFGCKKDYDPGDVKLRGMLRVEGTSDPDDEVVVAALECPCGEKGTLVFTYGPSADAMEAEAFRTLDDARER